MAEVIKGNRGDHIEVNCCIEFEGKSFCSGGSWLMRRKDTGLLQGILYLFREFSGENDRFVNFFVGTWDGSMKVHAVRLNTWKGNFGDERMHFYFKWQGKKFWGISAGDNDIVRCREYKRQ